MTDKPPRRYRRTETAHKPGTPKKSRYKFHPEAAYVQRVRGKSLRGLPTLSDKVVRELHRTGQVTDEDAADAELARCMAAIREANAQLMQG